MGTTETAFKPRSGLLTAIDVIIAPKAAFERIAMAPTWVWGFLISAILSIAANLIALPAAEHAIAVWLPTTLAHNSTIAAMPPDQQQKVIAQQISITQLILKFGWIIGPIWILLSSLVQAGVLFCANAATRGKATFGRLWALSMNVAVVGFGVTGIVTALVVIVRGPDGFDSPQALANAVPGLGLLAPAGNPGLTALLTPFNIVNLWAAALLALGLTVVARMRTTPAVVSVAVMFIAWALIGSIAPAVQK